VSREVGRTGPGEPLQAAPGAVLRRLADVAGTTLTPWQERAASALLNGATWTVSRRNGRSQIQCLLAEEHARGGEHVHVGSAAGTWCLTLQPAGFLYALVRPAGKHCQLCGKVKR
jgi:hypothetical protein